jgi:hypothetical protein
MKAAKTKANQEDLLARMEDIRTNQVMADENLKEIRPVVNVWIVDMKDG